MKYKLYLIEKDGTKFPLYKTNSEKEAEYIIEDYALSGLHIEKEVQE